MITDLHNHFNKIAEIPSVDWDNFEKGLQLKKYSVGDILLKEGQISETIGFVSKGMFRMYYRSEKKDVNYNFFAEGQFVVDYESYLRSQPTIFIIEALEDSEIYTFSKAHFLHQFQNSHAWERFGRLITEHVFLKSRDRIKQMLFMNAEERYLKFTEQFKGLHNRLPLYHIASYIGIDAASLSRIRKSLARK